MASALALAAAVADDEDEDAVLEGEVGAGLLGVVDGGRVRLASDVPNEVRWFVVVREEAIVDDSDGAGDWETRGVILAEGTNMPQAGAQAKYWTL